MDFNLIVTVAAAVILFLFGIDSFSKEVQRVGGVRFRKFVSRWTHRPWQGAFAGAFVTALVQSSSAASVIAVALVNTGVLSFGQSLPIIIGTNVGTTVTAQLVAWKLTGIGPVFIVLGFLLSLIRIRYSFLGKSIFYFGFVFFSLEMISSAVEPLKNNHEFLKIVAQTANPFFGIVVGALFTALVQSSSVTTGISVILVQQGILSVEQGILIVLGANIGTTFTSVIASWNMDVYAKKSALGHLLFNFLGVLLVLPVLPQFEGLLVEKGSGNAGQTLANAHLFFNLGAMVVFLVLLKPFTRLIDLILRAKEEEIVFKARYLPEKPSDDFSANTDMIKKELLALVKAASSIVDLAMRGFEAPERRGLSRAAKLTEYIEFIAGEISLFAQQVARQDLTDKNSKDLASMIQLALLFKEVGALLRAVASQVESAADKGGMSPESLITIRKISELSLKSLAELENLMNIYSVESYAALKTAEDVLNREVLQEYGRAIHRIQTGTAPGGGILIEFLSVAQKLREKVNSSRKSLKQIFGAEPTLE